MISNELTLTATPQAIGTGSVLQAIIYIDTGGKGELRLTSGNKLVAIIDRERFILKGPNSRPIEAAEWSLTGTGQAVVFLQEAPSEPVPPSPFVYSSRDSFNLMLDSAFGNRFIADPVEFTLKTGGSEVSVRANVEDQQTIVGDGLTQAQGIQRTAMIIAADLPAGWSIGDTVTYRSITYRTVEVIEQDEYSVTFALSKQPK